MRLTELTGNIIDSVLQSVWLLKRRINTRRLLARVKVLLFWITMCGLSTLTWPATFAQSAESLTITAQPLPQTDCYGNHVEFSVSVTGSTGTIYYQWQQKPPGSDFSDISGANTALLSINSIGVNRQNVNGTEYRVLITDECTTLTSDPALLSVNSITDLTPATVNSAICDRGEITYKLFSEGQVINNGYQWAYNNGTGWVFLSDDGPYSGTNTSQLTISNVTSAQNGSYRVSVIFTTLNQPPGDPTCIETSFTRERNLIVREPLSPPVVSGNQQLCYGSSPSTLTATPPSGGSGPDYSYQWQISYDGDTWTDIPGENTTSYSPPEIMTTTQYRLKSFDGGTPQCGYVNSNAVLIIVNPLPATSAIYHR